MRNGKKSRYEVGLPPEDLWGKARKDAKHAVVDGVIRNRKTGAVVTKWGDGKTTNESR